MLRYYYKRLVKRLQTVCNDVTSGLQYCYKPLVTIQNIYLSPIFAANISEVNLKNKPVHVRL